MNLANLVVEYLFSDENKEKILKELNDNINIPIINEKTEGKILEAVYGVFEDVLRSALKK